MNAGFGALPSLILLAVLAPIAYAAWKFAPWVPTHAKDIGRALRLAELKAGESFVELGCGDGRVVVAAAEDFGAEAIGYEIAVPLFLACLFRKLRHPSSHIRFRLQSLFSAPLDHTDVVYLFGVPKTLAGALKTKLERELKPGSRVISYAFKIEGWTPKAVDKPDAASLPIYLYSR